MQLAAGSKCSKHESSWFRRARQFLAPFQNECLGSRVQWTGTAWPKNSYETSCALQLYKPVKKTCWRKNKWLEEREREKETWLYILIYLIMYIYIYTYVCIYIFICFSKLKLHLVALQLSRRVAGWAQARSPMRKKLWQKPSRTSNVGAVCERACGTVSILVYERRLDRALRVWGLESSGNWDGFFTIHRT